MTNPVYRSKAWAAARKRVLLRDGYVCQIRLPGCRGKANTVDHIVGLKYGGDPYSLDNLQAACAHCNPAKARYDEARRAVKRRQW